MRLLPHDVKFYDLFLQHAKITLNAAKKGSGPSKSVALNMKSGETTSGIKIVFDKPHFIAGKVIIKGGKPVASASIYAYTRNGGGQSATTEADGKFRSQSKAC